MQKGRCPPLWPRGEEAAASAGLGWKTSEVGPSCPAPERPPPERVLETGLRVARWPRGNFTKESETRANLPGRDKV